MKTGPQDFLLLPAMIQLIRIFMFDMKTGPWAFLLLPDMIFSIDRVRYYTSLASMLT